MCGFATDDSFFIAFMVIILVFSLFEIVSVDVSKRITSSHHSLCSIVYVHQSYWLHGAQHGLNEEKYIERENDSER